MKYEHYKILAQLFKFPDKNYRTVCQEVQKYFDENEPEIGTILSNFTNELGSNEITIHELFVCTFDVQAITTLDIGYVLFGDDYKRGEILANLNRELKAHHIDSRGELSDHLSNVLQLMSGWNNAELRAEFAGLVLFPALIKMRNEFNPSIVKKKNIYYKKAFKTVLDTPENLRLIYKYCLSAVIALLQIEFPAITLIQNDTEGNDFLVSLAHETAVENAT
tara:strand:- start:145 stop:807 length:663 start_codon:yes stop_codon:yes gene_type:complete